MSDKKQKKAETEKPVANQAELLSEEKVQPTKKEAEDKKPVTEIRARLRFLKISDKKVRLVIDVIRGLGVEAALNKLKVLNKGSVPAVAKLLNSAVANAEHNFKLKKEDLYVKKAAANQGPTLHRWKPAAFGSAHAIRQRSTHLEIVLGVKEGAMVKDQARPEKAKVKKEEGKEGKKASREKGII